MKTTTITIKKSKNFHAWSNFFVGHKMIATVDVMGTATVHVDQNPCLLKLDVNMVSGFVSYNDYELS